MSASHICLLCCCDLSNPSGARVALSGDAEIPSSSWHFGSKGNGRHFMALLLNILMHAKICPCALKFRNPTTQNLYVQHIPSMRQYRYPLYRQ